MTPRNDISDEVLEKILARFEALEGLLEGAQGEEYVALAKEHGALRVFVREVRALRGFRKNLREAQEMAQSADAEMAALAREEVEVLREQVRHLEERLTTLLVEEDKDDRRNIILEVRPGTGGDEAALFAGDLFRMYQRYAQLQGWTLEILGASFGIGGGYKEVVASIKGEGVFWAYEV